MKKSLIMLLSAMTMNTAMADYTVTIGHGLPTESIQFVDKTPAEPELPPEPPKVPECANFNYSNNYTFFQNYGDTESSDPYYGSILYWNGVRVTSNSVGTRQPKVVSFDVGGYRYTSDGKLGLQKNYSNVSYKGFYYGICRVPL